MESREGSKQAKSTYHRKLCSCSKKGSPTPRGQEQCSQQRITLGIMALSLRSADGSLGAPVCYLLPQSQRHWHSSRMTVSSALLRLGDQFLWVLKEWRSKFCGCFTFFSHTCKMSSIRIPSTRGRCERGILGSLGNIRKPAWPIDSKAKCAPGTQEKLLKRNSSGRYQMGI